MGGDAHVQTLRVERVEATWALGQFSHELAGNEAAYKLLETVAEKDKTYIGAQIKNILHGAGDDPVQTLIGGLPEKEN